MAQFTVTINSYTNLPPSQLGERTLNLGYNELYVFSLTDFTNTVPPYVDPEGDSPETIRITSALLSTGSLELNSVPVVLNQDIDVADINLGLLTYQADPLDTDGYIDSFDFDIADAGSSTLSGLTTGGVTLNIGAEENLPPSEIGDGSATIDYGQTLVFTSAMFTTGTTPVYSDPEGDNPANVKILTLPLLGEILYNGNPVSINQIVSISDIDLGLLTYTPDLADTDGDVQGFTFAVSDTGSGEFVE